MSSHKTSEHYKLSLIPRIASPSSGPRQATARTFPRLDCRHDTRAHSYLSPEHSSPRLLQQWLWQK